MQYTKIIFFATALRIVAETKFSCGDIYPLQSEIAFGFR